MEASLEADEGPLAGQAFAVAPGRTVFLGAGPGVQVRLAGPGIEARHAAVRLDPGGLVVVDLGGAAGTTLDGVRLPARAPTPAPPGARLGIGPHLLRCQVLGDDGRPLARAPAAADALAPPAYEVVRELGRGGMGRVLEGRRRADGLPVAIKVLSEATDPASADHQRFLREAQVGLRLRSPHVVGVLEAGVLPSAPGRAPRAFIVMELVRGPSARDLVGRGPLPLLAALRAGEDAALGLAAAAAAGVVHRDVKPANLLVDAAAGVARLCDFGVAKDLGAAVRSLTRSGQGLGTLAYMAPELISEARHVDPRADVYGLGATLFHLAAGRPPFAVTSVKDLVATLDRPAPRLEAAAPGCPPGLSDLVARALEKDPHERDLSARDLAAALADLRARFAPGDDLRAALAAACRPPE